MSCWREYNANLKNVDKDILREACKRMGMDLDESVKHIETTYGSYEHNEGTVDAAIVKDGRQLQLGLVYADANAEGKLGVRGDFWGTGIDQATFVGQLGQYYQEIAAPRALENAGWTIENTEINADGDTEIELYMTA